VEGQTWFVRLVRIGIRGQEKEQDMRTIRRRNWFMKRIALGFAIAAFAAPVAQGRVDEGLPGQPNAPQTYKASHNVMPPTPRNSRIIPCVPACGHEELLPQSLVDQYGDQGSAANAHKPRPLGGALPRTDPQGSWGPIAAILADQPSATGFDWDGAGIGAGLALALVLLGGGAVLVSRQLGRAQTA
jgi:hypothetical protein